MSAAELELNISLSTISKHIKDLEQRLGLTLCQRGREGFAVTDEGLLIYQETVNLLAANYINTLPPASALRQLPATTPDARYYRISNELGQPVRLSAKFAPLYYQLLSDLETESGAAGTSFKQMQQALLHGSFMPDPANLFDVVSLKDVLENDQ